VPDSGCGLGLSRLGGDRVRTLDETRSGPPSGDFFAVDSGLGYEGAAVVFAGALVLLAVAYFYTRTSRTLLFWSAFILTRPLGAALVWSNLSGFGSVAQHFGQTP
jgi:Repeat of Unknown Function (DUF347)